MRGLADSMMKKGEMGKIRGVPNCRGRRRSVQKEIGKERKTTIPKAFHKASRDHVFLSFCKILHKIYM